MYLFWEERKIAEIMETLSKQKTKEGRGCTYIWI
jgi:hypothetical protein